MKQRFLIALSTLLFVLLLTACGGTTGSTTGDTARTNVQVTETDFHIDAALTRFTPGITYHFVVTNNGKTVHEFMIMPKSEGSMGGMPMGDMDKLAFASISNINPGETKTLDYTFSSTVITPHPEFACYLPGHYEAGMKQATTVKL